LNDGNGNPADVKSAKQAGPGILAEKWPRPGRAKKSTGQVCIAFMLWFSYCDHILLFYFMYSVHLRLSFAINDLLTYLFKQAGSAKSKRIIQI